MVKINISTINTEENNEFYWILKRSVEKDKSCVKAGCILDNETAITIMKALNKDKDSIITEENNANTARVVINSPVYMDNGKEIFSIRKDFITTVGNGKYKCFGSDLNAGFIWDTEASNIIKKALDSYYENIKRL